ncbi:MAG: TetR family transcriptional regulator [Pseudonocardiaceae bacterium]|nr:MAG: TetR family transcriptional regulator [Pseudonocardiaceae bacterium]
MSPPRNPHSSDPRARAAATKRNRTRRALLDAADAAFTARGWARTRIEDVAATAGVSPATAYNHFPAKHALIAEVYAPLIAPLVATEHARAAGGAEAVDGDPATLVVEQIRALARVCVRNRGLTAAYWAAVQDYAVRVQAVPEPDDEQDPRTIAPVADVLHDLVERGQAAGELRPDPPADTLCPILVDVLLTRIALHPAETAEPLTRLVAGLALGVLAPERVAGG